MSPFYKRGHNSNRCPLLFTWGEVNELHPDVAESHDLLEVLSSPQGDTFLMEGGQVRALW